MQNNNESFVMTLTRRSRVYEHTVIPKSHQITVNADTGNETHTLTLVSYDDNGRL